MNKNKLFLILMVFFFSFVVDGATQPDTVSKSTNQKRSTEESSATQTIQRLGVSAQDQLQSSIDELNKLREVIAFEKLPLSKELTDTEENLLKMRRENERISRLVDSGNLEMTTIKAEIKARQDELSYIGNLLDEYVRTFESKIHISEWQSIGDILEKTKKVAENPTLLMTEKFKIQIDFANLTVKRLFDVIGGMRFSGVGVNMQGRVVDGQYALIGPVVLFKSKLDDTVGLAIVQSGSTKPLIRPLQEEHQKNISNLLDQGEGVFPLDPSKGGALKSLVQKVSLIHIFEKGGPIMWPLLLAAVLALIAVIERLIFLFNEHRNRDPQALDQFFAALSTGDSEAAIRISKASRYYVVRALGYALIHKEKSLPNALLYAQEQEMKRFRRGIPILDTVITLAPLLGLLGTVTGMMGSFSLIGGDLGAPGAITGGIAEALIATAFGLGIAIVALIPFNYLNTQMEEARIEIESAAAQLELVVHPPENLINVNPSSHVNVLIKETN